MRFLHRLIEKELLTAAKAFSAILLTGPRRSGKTTVLRRLFPKSEYYLLEDTDIIARVNADPRGFLEGIRGPVILDEIQNVPELFRYIRTQIDQSPAKKGQFLLTGSQEAPLMKGVTESMAGRIALFQLLPFSFEETAKVSLFKGGFPEVLERPRTSPIWFRSYIQTYLERDVRAVSSIRDLSTFRRFLSLLASRSGQILNKSDLAAPLGMSVPTITEWLSILEITAQILIVPPFYENFGKRLIKSPKIYFSDSGLLCHLLGLESAAAVARSVFCGAVFEGVAAAEIVKAQINRGRKKEIYFFRDQQGLEVDFLVPIKAGRLALIEAKSSRTLRPNSGESLDRLAAVLDRYRADRFVVYSANPTHGKDLSILRPDVKAIPVDQLAQLMDF